MQQSVTPSKPSSSRYIHQCCRGGLPRCTGTIFSLSPKQKCHRSHSGFLLKASIITSIFKVHSRVFYMRKVFWCVLYEEYHAVLEPLVWFCLSSSTLVIIAIDFIIMKSSTTIPNPKYQLTQIIHSFQNINTIIKVFWCVLYEEYHAVLEPLVWFCLSFIPISKFHLPWLLPSISSSWNFLLPFQILNSSLHECVPNNESPQEE